MLEIVRVLRVLPEKRIVGEALWKGTRVLAKLFIAGAGERHSRVEAEGICALTAAGIPTPRLIAVERFGGDGHAVLTDFFGNAQSIAQALEHAQPLRVGHALGLQFLRPALRLLGQMHAGGLLHDDLHLGNFLLHDDKAYVIDGDAVKPLETGRRAAERVIANLALLLAQLPLVWDEQRPALLDAYAEGAGGSADQHPVDGERLQREISRIRAARLAEFLSKTVRECSQFAVTKTALRFSVVRRELADELALLLAAPDAAIARAKLLKDGGSASVACIECAGTVGTVVVKRYNLKDVKHWLQRFWRPTRAWHSWRAGHLLEFFGIATPAPLALVEERIGPLRRRGFLINAFCPGVDLLQQLAPDQEPDGEIGRAIVELFGTLHALRVSHGDLKATNLLWHDGRVVIIDLDSLVQHASPQRHARAWRRDRQRFLRNWPATSPLHRWLDANLPAH